MTTASQARSPWTEEEDEILRMYGADMSYADVGSYLPGRTQQAVSKRLTSLHLGESRKTNRGLCYSVSDVADVLGLTYVAARDWIRRGEFGDVEIIKTIWGNSNRARHCIYRVPWPSVDDFIQGHPFLFSLVAFPENPACSLADHKLTLRRARPELWMNSDQAARYVRLSANRLLAVTRTGRIPCSTWRQFKYFHRHHLDCYKQLRRQERGN